MTTILRHIFPLRSPCPNAACCAVGSHSRHGRSRGGLMEYRRCRRCRERYVVEAIGSEIVDDGATTSRIVTPAIAG